MPAGNAHRRKLRTLREAVRAATYRDEAAAVRALLSSVDLSMAQRQRIMGRARDLVQACRARSAERSLLDSFLQEFGLSNEEGIALMCLAESLLRVPDARTAEELVADKLAAGNWTEHVGASESFFVNASTWALILTGNVLSLSEPITRDAASWFGGLVSRLGEGVARAGVARAMRILGGGFILGRNIEEALANERGALSSFDMLGEAARTAADAERYLDAYRTALAATAAAYPAATPTTASGISVKLSALHPLLRQSRRATVLPELSLKVAGLAAEAARANVHLTIDAEEAARLELTLDIFEHLARHDDTAGWQGLGIAVQAYSKRAPAVLDWLAELARATSRRIMVRLVKGAYWDTEIKRAQVGGFEEYPVFTRKASTDLSYIACATRLCRAPDALFPQFATHNAHTLATVVEIGGETDFEMQRLHGMGELLYDETRREFPELPSIRVYAPVGAHEDLLPYLVRRLLENGANSSFVNRFLDAEISLNEVVRDPLADVTHFDRIRHPRIALPRDLYGDARTNSEGIDLDHPGQARALTDEMDAFRAVRWGDAGGEAVVNPANREDVVGTATTASRAEIDKALGRAIEAQPRWNASPATERAEALLNTARAYEAHRAELAALLVREGGKTLADALAEIREAVDFCRYYAGQCRLLFGQDIALPGPNRGEQHAATARSGRLRVHRALELSARDLHRPGGGRAGRRQRCRREAGRADTAGRASRHRTDARGRGSGRCPAPAAGQRRRGRAGAGGRRPDRRRRLHGIDRNRPGDTSHPGRAARAHRAPHRRDRRTERHAGRLHRTARAGGGRHRPLGLRLRRSTLFGAPGALRAGRHRRAPPRDARRRHGRAPDRRSLGPGDRRGTGHPRRRPRRARCPRRGTGRPPPARVRTARALQPRHVRRATGFRDQVRSGTRRRALRSRCCMSSASRRPTGIEPSRTSAPRDSA